MPMMQLFDKGVTLRMGQAHVKRWIDDIMPLVTDDEDPLGTEDFATHKLPLAEAPDAYETFQKKEDDAIKVVFQPPRPEGSGAAKPRPRPGYRSGGRYASD